MATAGHAETERGATRIGKSVFLVSALVWRSFCGCRCNNSKKGTRRARRSALARRLAIVGEREEKKILKRRNDESG